MPRHFVSVRALFLILGFSNVAIAETPFQCFANGGVSTPLRVEGITESVGDLVLVCIGGVPTAPGVAIPPVDVQISLNTALTSRLLTSTSSGQQYSEALVILDEPAPGFQYACVGAGGSTVCPGYGNGLGSANPPSLLGYYGSGVPGSSVAGCTQGVTFANCPGNNKNVFQAVQTSTNSVTFLGVPIDPPGISGSRVVRITNIRANANALGVAGSNAPPTPIVETIAPTPAALLPVSNPSQTVAFTQRGLTFGVFSTNTIKAPFSPFIAQQCDNSRNAPSQAASLQIAALRYTENFATAFKKRFTQGSTALPSNGPAAAIQQNSLTIGTYNTESGFVSNLGAMATLPSGAQTGAPGDTAGFADWGTRVKAVFNNIPNGVTLFVDTDGVWTGTFGATTATCNNVTNIYTTCLDHFSMTATQDGPYSTVGSTATSPNGNHTSQLVLNNGAAVAVWEDLDSDPNTFASVNFGVWIQYTPSPGTNSPALATATVNGSYAPTSAVTTAAGTIVPRLADTSTSSEVFTVTSCACASDMSAAVSVTRGGFSFNFATGRFLQNVTIRNTGGSFIAGPISLALDNLSSNATLFNAAGATSCAAPSGSPYIGVNVGGGLAPGASASVVLQFTRTGSAGITYNTRVLGGSGGR
jgi:hypothetical protein